MFLSLLAIKFINYNNSEIHLIREVFNLLVSRCLFFIFREQIRRRFFEKFPLKRHTSL